MSLTPKREIGSTGALALKNPTGTLLNKRFNGMDCDGNSVIRVERFLCEYRRGSRKGHRRTSTPDLENVRKGDLV